MKVSLIFTVLNEGETIQRLLNYARVVGPERVVAGSDCGFGTFLGQGPVAPSVTWSKLQAMAAGARLATAEVGGRSAA